MQKQLTAQENWSLGKKIRTFLGVYFLFLIFDFTSSDELFPHFVYILLAPYTNFWHWLVPWTGEHILHLSYPITVRPNGSGDTTYNYVLQLLWIVFTILIAALWVLFDRKRPSYHQLYYWSRIIIRYFLAYMLFVYGFVKIIKLQFPEPSLYRLIEPFGESSPMGLAWTFIGYSKGYNIFIGGTEVFAGLLLFFKRTTLFGALMAMTVMANVVAMNFAYDIPVKLFSLNLFFLALWIAWYDKDRLVNFLFLNKNVAPATIEYQYRTKWKKIVQLLLKTVAISFAFYATLWSNFIMSKQYGDTAPKPLLYGIYDVEIFNKNKKAIPPLTTDAVRWKRMVINSPGRVGLFTMTNHLTIMNLKIDSLHKIMTFTSPQDSTQQFILEYTKKGTRIDLSGTISKDSIFISLKRFKHENLPLNKTKFHWINEYSALDNWEY